MKIKKTILTVALSFLFASCSYLPTDELIRPPQMTEEQNEIHNELKAAIGNEQITFKYPKSGKYPSAIVLKNLDDDAEEEAIAFYKLDTGESTRINILDKKDDKWVSVYDMAGYGDEIDFLDFANMTKAKGINIIIGWSSSGTDKKVLTAYSYANGELSQLADYKYDYVVISDVDANGLDDILLVDFKNRDIIRLLGSDEDENNLDTISQADLSSNVVDIMNITVGKMDNGVRAIYVDEKKESGRYKTDIFSIKDGELVNVIEYLEEGEKLNTAFSERQIDIISKDYNGDGVIDVPSTEPMPGYEDDDDEPVYLTYFWNIEDSKIRTAFYAAINQKYNYMVKYPTRWVDTITVEKNSLTGEWAFVFYEEDEDVQMTPYLRVRVYAKKDYKDKYESQSFILKSQKGMFEYYTYIPTAEGDFAITNDELNEMFVLLS